MRRRAQKDHCENFHRTHRARRGAGRPDGRDVVGGDRITARRKRRLLFFPTIALFRNLAGRGVLAAGLALRLCASASAALVMPSSRPISISAAFDAGNIERVGSSDDDVVSLKIRPDVPTELEKKTHLQWWYFRSAGGVGQTTYEIVNAGEVSFPDAWEGYQVCASTDRQTWSRVGSTRYADGKLSWTYDHATDAPCYFAYVRQPKSSIPPRLATTAPPPRVLAHHPEVETRRRSSIRTRTSGSSTSRRAARPPRARRCARSARRSTAAS